MRQVEGRGLLQAIPGRRTVGTASRATMQTVGAPQIRAWAAELGSRDLNSGQSPSLRVHTMPSERWLAVGAGFPWAAWGQRDGDGSPGSRCRGIDESHTARGISRLGFCSCHPCEGHFPLTATRKETRVTTGGRGVAVPEEAHDTALPGPPASGHNVAAPTADVVITPQWQAGG